MLIEMGSDKVVDATFIVFLSEDYVRIKFP